ncbi:MAG: DUF4412 domain-containing protein [Nitrospiraceae bacterium]|nr:DUF4412 domain-containing protein [Nitrospiraceae bacterium]
MNIRTSAFVLAIGMLGVPGLSKAGDFEGILHMKMTHFDMGSQPTAMDWYVKGDMARMERKRQEGQNHVMIMDGQKRTMVMLMPEKKVAMEFNLDAASDKMGDLMKEEIDKKSVDRTGKTDKVAGYSCEVWRVIDKETKKLELEICVAKGFGRGATAFLDPKRVQDSSQPAWVKQLVKEGGFGLRTIHFGEDGKESSRSQVTGVERKSLDANLFTVPSDYARQNLSDIANKMKAGREQMQQGQGGADFEKMMRDAKQRRAQRSGDAAAGGEAPPEAAEMMKKLQEMMKKQQQQGGQ